MRVAWHRSLFVRVFAIGALIALVAVAAATWATVRSTTVAVRQARQQSLHDQAVVYDALTGYAATHRDWVDAGALVDRVARETGREVSVTDPDGRVLVSSGPGKRRDPTRARATIDPLAVDPALLASARGSSGPAAASPAPAACAEACQQFTVPARTSVDVRAKGPFPDRAATAALQQRADACLARAGLGPLVSVDKDFTAVVAYAARHGTVAECVDQGRRQALRSYVAPAGLLVIGGDDPSADVAFDLSAQSRQRIVLLAGGVLVATLLLCLGLASYVARPLRTMAEAALRAGDGDLDVRVPDRRRDEVGQVAQAFNTMAERRARLEVARRRMVGDVSHELRNPMANIRGWLEAAQDGVTSVDGRLVDRLHVEALQLQLLVDDLHDLALADAGELELAIEEIDLAAFLAQVADAHGASADVAGVTLAVSVRAGASVVADPGRLRQVVGNLVANALRHTPGGGTVRLVGGPGEVLIADTGEGIPVEDVDSVFDRFRRLDPSRSRATGGSGLGLAIVRQIVEAHGGTVDLTSEVDSGTTVTVRLPSTDR